MSVDIPTADAPVTASAAIVLEPPIVRAPPAVSGSVAALGQGWLNPWYASWGVSLSATEEDRLAWVCRRPDGVPARRRRPALAFRGARSRHRRQRVPRIAPRRAPRAGRSRRRDRPPVSPRPDVDGGHRAAFRRDSARARFHLAAEVGGIGANRANPGRYWYANLMMGAHVIEQARVHETPRWSSPGRSAPTRSSPRPVPRGRPVERLSGGDERALRRREEDDPRRRAGLSGAVRHECDLPPPRQPVRAGRQLRPRDLARDRRAHPQDGRGAGTRQAGDRAVGKRHADSRVPLRGRLRGSPRAGRRALRRRRPGERRHRQGDRDRRPGGVGARRDRVRGDDPLGYVKPNGQPRRRLDTTRAVELFGFTAAVPLEEGLARTVAWYRENHEP